MISSTNNTSQTDPILAARDLTKEVMTRQGPLTILSGVSLTVKPSESIAIVGASGSGKSTLLGLLAGLDTPTQGQVVLAGQSLGTLNEDQRARVRSQCVGFVFQNFQLLPALTAEENVMLPLELSGFERPQQEADRLLAAVGLEARGHHYPRQLSGGEQQRVAVARAFACQPRILFADEPTGNLDRQTGAHLIELLFELNRAQSTTLVLVTHDHELAARCERSLELRDGHLEPCQ